MSVRVRFVVDYVALEQVFLRVLRSCHVSVMPPMLYTTFHIQFAVSRPGEDWEPSRNNADSEM